MFVGTEEFNCTGVVVVVVEGLEYCIADDRIDRRDVPVSCSYEFCKTSDLHDMPLSTSSMYKN